MSSAPKVRSEAKRANDEVDSKRIISSTSEQTSIFFVIVVVVVEQRDELYCDAD